jgi:uncharacterized protein (TIGR01777 family)
MGPPMTSPLLWSLIAIQIALGAFDMVYHHELTERLAWRPSQRRELQLHGIRNLLYALLFVLFGWSEPHGIWAMVVIAVLAVEALVTLVDFIEEDRSRKLPESERVLHTLLALNYGAILALLLPVLIVWAAAATALLGAWHGYWSVFATVAALGVFPFGLRDLAAARRAPRLARAGAGALMQVLGERRTVLVTGATGFIGRRLVEALAEDGHRVIALARSPAKAASLRPPFTLVASLDQIPGDCRIDAIVNLAGEPIADGLWTKAKRRRIVESRLAMTADVVTLIARLDRTPGVLVNGSAIGWYGLRGDEALDESAATGAPCFSHALCAAWEAAANKAKRYGVRVATLRIGLVLGSEGGMLARLLTPFEFGLGGPIGSGYQWMSWIERDDLLRLIAHIIASPALEGPLNATAPQPLRNAAFTSELGRALRRPAILRVPAGLLHRLGGRMADELLLGGQRVLPAKALASGFIFRHGTLAGALSTILGVAATRSGTAAIDHVEQQHDTDPGHHFPVAFLGDPADHAPAPSDKLLPKRPHGLPPRRSAVARKSAPGAF